MYNTYDDGEMMVNEETRIAPELKVGIYFCIFAFALATVIYVLCR